MAQPLLRISGAKRSAVLEENDWIDPEADEKEGFPYVFLLNPVGVLWGPADFVCQDLLLRI